MYINLHDILVSTLVIHYIKKLHKKQTVSHHSSFFFSNFREEPCHATVLMFSSHQSKLEIWRQKLICECHNIQEGKKNNTLLSWM